MTIGSGTYKIPEDLRREIREKIELEPKNVKSRYNKTRLNNVKFDIGDIVYVKGDKIATGESKNTSPGKKVLIICCLKFLSLPTLLLVEFQIEYVVDRCPFTKF